MEDREECLPQLPTVRAASSQSASSSLEWKRSCAALWGCLYGLTRHCCRWGGSKRPARDTTRLTNPAIWLRKLGLKLAALWCAIFSSVLCTADTPALFNWSEGPSVGSEHRPLQVSERVPSVPRVALVVLVFFSAAWLLVVPWQVDLALLLVGVGMCVAFWAVRTYVMQRGVLHLLPKHLQTVLLHSTLSDLVLAKTWLNGYDPGEFWSVFYLGLSADEARRYVQRLPPNLRPYAEKTLFRLLPAAVQCALVPPLVATHAAGSVDPGEGGPPEARARQHRVPHRRRITPARPQRTATTASLDVQLLRPGLGAGYVSQELGRTTAWMTLSAGSEARGDYGQQGLSSLPLGLQGETKEAADMDLEAAGMGGVSTGVVLSAEFADGPCLAVGSPQGLAGDPAAPAHPPALLEGRDRTHASGGGVSRLHDERHAAGHQRGESGVHARAQLRLVALSPSQCNPVRRGSSDGLAKETGTSSDSALPGRFLPIPFPGSRNSSGALLYKFAQERVWMVGRHLWHHFLAPWLARVDAVKYRRLATVAAGTWLGQQLLSRQARRWAVRHVEYALFVTSLVAALGTGGVLLLRFLALRWLRQHPDSDAD